MSPTLGPGPQNAITDVAGVRVGHWTDRKAATGCTALVFDAPVSTAVDVRGGAPGTRETDLLGAGMTVQQCNAILLSGGSAFGLDAASGVMRYLSGQGTGFATSARPVPIVPAAILYDLGIGDPYVTPGPDAGEHAARQARRGRIRRGSVGAGTGATVAKVLGIERALKGGIGSASVVGPGGLIVGALVACNAVGSVVDPGTGQDVAGPRADEPGRMIPLAETVTRHHEAALALREAENTTLGVIATNAILPHGDLQRLAAIGHDGYGRTIVPTHTRGDGDVMFALSTGEHPIEPVDHYALAVMALHAVERAVLDAVHSATGLKGVPSAAEWQALAPPAG